MNKIYIKIVDLNYLLKYFNICNKPDNCEYTEMHHILPKCLGGLDIKENIIKLNFKNHLKAHIYLALATKHNKLCLSAILMSGKKNFYNLTNKEINNLEKLKIEFSKNKSKEMLGKKNPFYNRSHTKESKKLISKNHANFSGKNNPMFGRKGKLAPAYGRVGNKHPMFKKVSGNRNNTIYHWFNNSLKLNEFSTMFTFYNKYNLKPNKVSALKNGKRYTHKGWKCLCLI